MKSVTVDQLSQTISEGHRGFDAELAKQLSKLQLTERLSTGRQNALELELPGNLSKQALLGLADASAFLPAPPAELISEPAPAVSSQIQCLKMAVAYLQKSFSTLPNLFAQRTVTLFADSPPRERGQVFLPYEPLHSMGDTTATVLYRSGQEVLDQNVGNAGAPEAPAKGLITRGEFGPILNIARHDAARSSLTWSHWERRGGIRVAVYHYAVPSEKSQYEVKFCCVSNGAGWSLYEQISAYHGEMTIDPSNGTVLRLTLQADLPATAPMSRADMMIEYGQVEIGGQNYYCPVRSISIATATVQEQPDASEPSRAAYFSSGGAPHWTEGDSQTANARFAPRQTLLDDIRFDKYHVFRADAQILQGEPSSK